MRLLHFGGADALPFRKTEAPASSGRGSGNIECRKAASPSIQDLFLCLEVPITSSYGGSRLRNICFSGDRRIPCTFYVMKPVYKALFESDDWIDGVVKTGD